MAVPAKTEIIYFCAVYNYVGKADYGKGYWNPKRKLGVGGGGGDSIHCFVFWRFLELL